MKICHVSALAALLSTAVHGNLVITEVNSNGTPGDFWELTNFGETAVDLSGFVWIDDKQSPTDPAAATVPAGTSLAPGESMIFALGVDAVAFRNAWNLPSSVQVIAGGPNLGSDDAVYLYRPSAAPVASLSYSASGFTRSNGTAAVGGHAGISAGGSAEQSLIYDPNFGPATPRYTFATGGNFDSYAANPPFTGVGSPGTVGEAGTNALPVFTNAPQTYWRSGLNLNSSAFRVSAVDTDPGQTVTLSVISKPAWLTLNPAGAGSYSLAGTPPAAGDYEFTVRATDTALPAGITEATFTLTVFPTSSPILLNEYNAVAEDAFLRGGDANVDENGISPGPTDSFFGRLAGNGGEWVEFVVVGTGTPGSTVDMRGWTVEVHGNSGVRTIALTQDPYWSNVIAGTLLTFTTLNSASGGLDTEIHKTSALHTTGHLWTNVWVNDPVLIAQSASTLDGGHGIGSEETRFVVKNAAGTPVYGPSGEGVASVEGSPGTFLGVNSREVLRLQQDPNPGIDPLFGAYNDADSSSTFGDRNLWGSGPTVQSFAPYVRTNSPPRFTTQPVTHAVGSYSYAIATTDPNGNPVSLSATDLPDFLTLTPGAAGTATLTSNRPLTAADAGEYLIRLVANDGGTVAAVTPQAFLLTVFHDAPTVILNEYNAVAPDSFINGGDATIDVDGPPASIDTHFGRVAGNGGAWFELVVVGNGGPSTVDLRGWSIDIGTSAGGEFLKSNILVLSQDSYWAAVPAGTLLTFIDRNTASGGLDTEIERRDRLVSEGDIWTNVWMGDPNLLAYSGEVENGYAINSGTVTGIRIDNANTQFILRNAAGHALFGPVGEGIAPVSAISGTEVFELQAHPSPTVSPLAEVAVDGTGYDDSTGSTFGHPNQWLANGGTEVFQDFSAFIANASPYQSWVSSFGLQGSNAERTADQDADGRDNLTEYAFGGNPSVADAAPVPQEITHGEPTITWSFLRRSDDSTLSFELESSPDLVAWTPLSPADYQLSEVAETSLPGYSRVTIEIAAGQHAERFFRSTAN